MRLEEFLSCMMTGNTIKNASEAHLCMHELSQEAIKITSEINNEYHTPDELRKLFSKLIGKKVDDSFNFFPPFYTDCGKNITVGKDVFINMGCKFQDQGGILIGNGVLIGHNVVLATLNHSENPDKRKDMIPAQIIIKDDVWIGANSTILSGVTIGKGAIVAAGAVVTKDVEENTVVAGIPARVIKTIK